MNKTIKYILNPIMADLTFFGGLVFYAFMMGLFFAVEDYMLFIDLIIGIVLAYIFVSIIRLSYHKDRPKKKKSDGSWVQRIDSSSFPSMHSTRATILFVLIGMSFSTPLIWLLFAGVLIVVLYSRICLKMHDIVDVFAGVVLGTLISILVIALL